MEKAERISDILSREWNMFQKVQNTGGRASCQDDQRGFCVMRGAQFAAWDDAMLASYQKDLIRAEEAGENLLSEKYGYMMREDAGRGYRRVVASPKPAEIVEIGAIRSLVDSGQLVIACGGGGIPVTRQGNHLKGASAVIDKDFASELLAEELNADFLIILTAVEKVAINFGKPEEKWLDDLDTEEARKFIKEGHFAPGSMLPKVQAAVKFAESKPGRTALITLLEKAKDGIQGKTGTHIHLA